MPQRPASPAWWKTLLLCLVVVPLFFSLLEVVLWAAGVPTLLAERDPFQGFSRRVRAFEEDRQRGVMFTPSRAVRQSFNSQQFLIDKPAMGFRLFVLGGSSAKGFPWGPRTAFPAVLGDALRASWPGRTIESVNAAAMSYGSHRLRVLAHELIGYEADALVVYEGHNEFVEDRFYREVLERREQLDGAREMLHQWRLYALMTRMAEALRLATGHPMKPMADRSMGELLGLDVAREDATETDARQKERVRARFEENLRAIVDLAEDAGVPIVLCTVASNVRDWEPNQSLFDPAAGHEDRTAAQAQMLRGIKLLAASDASGALIELERAQALAPAHAEIAYRLAQALEALGRWDESREAYARARDLDAQPARALSSINETIRRVARERRTVLVDIERLFEERSRHGLVGFNLTEDYVHPTPEGHRLIALALWKAFNEEGLLGQRRESTDEEFWAAVGHAPHDAAAALGAGDEESTTAAYLFNLAVVLEHQGLSDQAIEKYTACLELDPAYGAAAFNLGLILNARSRWAQAAERFQQALRADPDDVASLSSLGLAQAKLGQEVQAIETLRRATRIEPESAMAWTNLGYLLSLQGSDADAIAALRKAVELAPEHPIPLANLGSVLQRAGLQEEAIKWLRASLEKGSDLPETRHALAEALHSKGDLAGARELYRRCLDADPNDAVAAAGLARIGAHAPGS